MDRSDSRSNTGAYALGVFSRRLTCKRVALQAGALAYFLGGCSVFYGVWRGVVAYDCPSKQPYVRSHSRTPLHSIHLFLFPFFIPYGHVARPMPMSHNGLCG